MKRKTIQRAVSVVFSKSNMLYVNGEAQRGICNGWVGLLIYGKMPTTVVSPGVWNVALRRGLPPWQSGWNRGRITKGQRFLFAHTIGADDSVHRRGRVPRGPIATALRALLGKSSEAVIWYKAEKIEVA